VVTEAGIPVEQEKIWDYYQNEGVEHGAFNEARQRFIMKYLSPGQEVLNIGVGRGALERLGQERSIRMHSLDPSERAITRLREQLDLGQRARAGYAQQNPFADEQFHVVVMCEVLEHLDEPTLAAALGEGLRVLKPGGFMFATVPYRENLQAKRVICPACGERFHRIGHVQSFDRQRFRDLFTDHGYVVSRLWLSTFVDWRRPGLANRVKSVVRLGLARLGKDIADPHLVCIARKPAPVSN